MIRVQWRATGEYLCGYVEGPGFIWGSKPSAMKFSTIEQFRAFESGGPLPMRWNSKREIKFCRVRT